MIGTRNSGLLGWIILSVILGCSLFAAELALADGPPVQWQKTFGGNGWTHGGTVQQTSDGGYIIAGTISTFIAYEADVYLIKTDPNGYFQWESTFGGDDFDSGGSVRQTTDGGYVVAGTTSSFGAGSKDVYLIKTDPNGDSQWQKTFGGNKNDLSVSVQQTVDGGYIIAGTTYSFGAVGGAVYLIKTDPNGERQWQRTFGEGTRVWGTSGQQTDDGGYIIAGLTANSGTGRTYVYLIKTDPNGNSQWEKTFGESYSDEGFSVQQTEDGGYIISGSTQASSSGSRDVYLIKTDPNGNSQWKKIFGASKNDVGRSVQQTVDSGYIIGGYTQSFGAGKSDIYLIKTDPNGDSQWKKTFGGSENENGGMVQQTSDGGYIITGYTSSFGVEDDHLYLIKLCSEGTLPGDLNCDGTVNHKDVEILVSQWLQPRSILYHADIYGVGDGIVDFFDYSTHAADFGKSSSPH